MDDGDEVDVVYVYIYIYIWGSISSVNLCWNMNFSLTHSVNYFFLSRVAQNATVNTVFNNCVFETFQTLLSLGQI